MRAVLTSGDWAEGWSRSLTPVSPSSHLTISPPGRHSRSGRLPAAPAPSPSRTQVCNDGVIKIQQISHISVLFSCYLRPLSLTAWCGKASERIPLTASSCCCCCCCSVVQVLLMLQSRSHARGSPGHGRLVTSARGSAAPHSPPVLVRLRAPLPGSRCEAAAGGGSRRLESESLNVMVK